MNDPQFELRRQELDPQTAVFALYGTLTFAAEGEMMAAFNDSLEEGVQRVVLDFNQLTFMNSTGIGLLVTLLVRANRSGTRLYATGLTPHYQEIFRMTRLEEAFTIIPDLQALPAL